MPPNYIQNIIHLLFRSSILVKTSNRSVLMSVFTLAVRSAIAVSYAYGDVTGVTQTTPISISARASGGGGDNVILWCCRTLQEAPENHAR